MPSARLVFNDDATVLGPVLERTGEMIKAATSDIPRLRLGQEQFAHGRSMDLANLKMRQDAAQAEQDRSLTSDLLGPGTVGGSSRSRSVIPMTLGGVTPSQQLAVERFNASQSAQEQRRSDAQTKSASDLAQKRRLYEAGLRQSPIDDPATPGMKRFRTDDEVQTLLNTAYPAMDPVLAADPDAALAGTYAESPLGDLGEVESAAGGPSAISGLLSLRDPDAEAQLEQQRAFDQQRRRAAWLQLKNDPQRAMRMGYDENRMNELYQQLWPDTGAEQAQPVQDAGPDLLTMRAADAAHASRGGQSMGLEPEQQPVEQPPIQQRGFRTPDEVRAAEHYRANDVDAAIKALVAKASADPDANLEPIQFLVNEQDPSGGMRRTPDLRDLLSLGQLSNLFTTGSMHPGLPEWMGGQRPIPRMTPRAAAQTPQQRIAETLDPLQANATFTNRLSIGQR